MQHEIPDLSPSARRVIVGVNGAAASTVVADERDLPCTRLPNGILLQELWQQRAHPRWAERSAGARVDTGAGRTDRRSGRSDPHRACRNGDALVEPDLHTDPSLHVITMLGGELIVMLEDGEVTLGVGDSIVCEAACMISEMCNPDRQRSCTPPSLLPRVAQSTIKFPDHADGPGTR